MWFKVIAIVCILAASVYGSIFGVRPDVGAYNYTIIGGLTSLVAGAVVATAARREHAPLAFSVALGMLVGAAAGAVWPAALFLTFAWFTFGRDAGADDGDRGDPPAVA